MTEAQFLDLCGLCDSILLDADAGDARLAISFLHVVRPHPVFLEQYEPLFGAAHPGNGSAASAGRLRRVARALLGLFRLVQKSGLLRPRWFARSLGRQADFLLVSHLVNRASTGREYDFYYGPLPEELHKRGHSTVVALIDQIGAASSEAVREWKGPVLRAIIPARRGITGTIADFLRLLRERSALLAGAKRAPRGLRSRLMTEAAARAASDPSLAAMQIGEAIGRLAGRIRARVVVMTYEGHAWERVAMRSIRRHNPGAICVGYNHAGVFELQHAMQRRLTPDCDPDRILVAGERSLQMLGRAPALQGIPVGVLGSDRGVTAEAAPGPAFRGAFEGGVTPACLVLPEGILSECLHLVRFSLECARSDSRVRFVWRLHPLLDYDHLVEIEPDLGKLPANVEVSRRSLEADVSLCHWALYRGTTAVFKAVAGGLRPVYYSQKSGELSIDPLYGLDGWRKVVTGQQQFKAVIDEDMRQTPKRDDAEFHKARAYCVSWYAPFDCNVLEGLHPGRGESS